MGPEPLSACLVTGMCVRYMVGVLSVSSQRHEDAAKHPSEASRFHQHDPLVCTTILRRDRSVNLRWAKSERGLGRR